MRLLNYDSLKNKINNYNDLEGSIFLEPLLESSQISSVCVDLRLDVNFLIPLKTNKPVISESNAQMENFFDRTYRKLGEKFVIYPGQYVLANTLEYIRLPRNIHAEIISRLSYDRLGIHFSTIVNPGYSGVLTLNIKSQAETPVELVVGSRIAQIKFFVDEENTTDYMNYQKGAKYSCAVELELSKIFYDEDLNHLKRICKIDL